MTKMQEARQVACAQGSAPGNVCAGRAKVRASEHPNKRSFGRSSRCSFVCSFGCASVLLQNISRNIRKKPYLTRVFDPKTLLLSEFDSKAKIPHVFYQAKWKTHIFLQRCAVTETRVKTGIFAIFLTYFCLSQGLRPPPKKMETQTINSQVTPSSHVSQHC